MTKKDMAEFIKSVFTKDSTLKESLVRNADGLALDEANAFPNH
jgi:hypothetical protein